MNYVVLVNKKNKIKDYFYKNIKFIDTKSFDNRDIKVEEGAYNAYLLLKEYLSKKNINIEIDTAYRDFLEQEEIYNSYLEKFGKEFRDNYAAPVGYSEHHTGLAIDIVIKMGNEFIYENHEIMDYKDILLEIHKSLSKFGFILRYPENKENVTGYNYEPWHIRYVSDVVADIIYKNNWTLEEYFREFSGVIVVNKEKDMTSFDVVNELSHLFGIKKIGHTGTLDPLAEGVLVVCIGKATKICELLTSTYKEYVAGVLLGVMTDTYDITGKVLDTKPVNMSLDIGKCLESFKKTYMQEVPIYSAVKVNGKKLYDYARNGKSVELPKKSVTIKEISLENMDNDTFIFRSLVSKGCYIRSLINNIGQALGTYATMTTLNRTKQGKFSINDAYYLDDIKKNKYKLLSIEEVLDYPVVEVDDEYYKKVSNGVRILNTYKIDNKVIFKYRNQLIGIYELDGDYLKTWKNFN